MLDQYYTSLHISTFVEELGLAFDAKSQDLLWVIVNRGYC